MLRVIDNLMVELQNVETVASYSVEMVEELVEGKEFSREQILLNMIENVEDVRQVLLPTVTGMRVMFLELKKEVAKKLSTIFSVLYLDGEVISEEFMDLFLVRAVKNYVTDLETKKINTQIAISGMSGNMTEILLVEIFNVYEGELDLEVNLFTETVGITDDSSDRMIQIERDFTLTEEKINTMSIKELKEPEIFQQLTKRERIMVDLSDKFIHVRNKYAFQDVQGNGHRMVGGVNNFVEYLEEGGTSTYLTNESIFRHLALGNKTYSVFSSKEYSKFFTLDIDMEEQSLEVAERIVAYLEEFAEIERGNILLAFSGNKGYHLTIFFEELVKIEDLKFVYSKILKDLELDGDLVELRPSHNVGIKLPLGLHQKTKNFCYLVDTYTMEQMNSINILSIGKLSFLGSKKFLDLGTELKNQQEQEKRERKIDNDSILKRRYTDEEDIKYWENFRQNRKRVGGYKPELDQIIENGYVDLHGRRHNILTQLMYYFTGFYGYSKSKMMVEIEKIVVTSAEHGLLGMDVEDAMREVERMSQYCTANNDNAVDYIQKYFITKTEMMNVIKAGKFNLILMAFSHLVHSKKYNTDNIGTYFLPYSQMEIYMNNGKALNRSRTKKHYKELEELGLLEIVDSNIKQKGTYKKDSNKYRVPYFQREVKDGEMYIEIDRMRGVSFAEALWTLCNEDEVEEVVTKVVSIRTYRKYFKEIMETDVDCLDFEVSDGNVFDTRYKERNVEDVVEVKERLKKFDPTEIEEKKAEPVVQRATYTEEELADIDEYINSIEDKDEKSKVTAMLLSSMSGTEISYLDSEGNKKQVVSEDVFYEGWKPYIAKNHKIGLKKKQREIEKQQRMEEQNGNNEADKYVDMLDLELLMG